MGRYTTSFLIIVSFFTLIAFSHGLSTVQIAQATPDGYFVLSEISPWQNDGAAWIELYNPAFESSLEFMSTQCMLTWEFRIDRLPGR